MLVHADNELANEIAALMMAEILESSSLEEIMRLIDEMEVELHQLN
jgi:hypothetical protein